MSRNTPSPEQIKLRLDRAGRFRLIRDATALTQPEFAERLTRLAREIGLANVSYDVGDITTRENGRKSLEIEDYLLATHIDPMRRTVLWLAYGRDLPLAVLNPRLMPRPPGQGPPGGGKRGKG